MSAASPTPVLAPGATRMPPRGRSTPVDLSDPRENPFVNATDWLTHKVPPLEVAKMVLMCLFLIPLIRLLLIVIAVVLVFLWVLLVTAGHRFEDANGRPVPLSCFRAALMAPMRWGCRFVLYCFGYWWIEERYWDGSCWKCGYFDDPATPRIVTPNHTAFVDAFFLAHKFIPSVVCKAGLVDIPVIGRIIQALNPIQVPRTRDQLSRMPSVIDQMKHRIASNDARFPPILIFPEGTTINQHFLLQFQRGAFVPGVPVQPVCLEYPYQNFDCSWTPGANSLWLLFRMLCQVYNRMRVSYLEPVVPTDAMKANPSLFAEEVRRRMAVALGRNVSDASDHDAFLVDAAVRGGFTQYAFQHLLSMGAEHPLWSSRSGHSHTQSQGREAAADGGGAAMMHRKANVGGILMRRGETATHKTVYDLIKLAQIFHEADKDHNGTLTLAEFEMAMASVGLDPIKKSAVANAALGGGNGSGGARKNGDTAGAGAGAGAGGAAAEDGASVRSDDSTESLSLEQRRWVEGLFELFDQDGDGELRYRELVLGLGMFVADSSDLQHAAAEAFHTHHFPANAPTSAAAAHGGAGAEAGAGAAGRGSGEEVVVAGDAVLEEMDSAEQLEELRLRLAFAVFDRDGDGKLTREELKHTLLAVDRVRSENLKRMGEAGGATPAVAGAAGGAGGAAAGGAAAGGAAAGGAAAGGSTGAAAPRLEGAGEDVEVPKLQRSLSLVVEQEVDELLAKLERAAELERGGAALPDHLHVEVDFATFKRLVANEPVYARLVGSAARAMHFGLGIDIESPRPPRNRPAAGAAVGTPATAGAGAAGVAAVAAVAAAAAAADAPAASATRP